MGRVNVRQLQAPLSEGPFQRPQQALWEVCGIYLENDVNCGGLKLDASVYEALFSCMCAVLCAALWGSGMTKSRAETPNWGGASRERQ